jgi:hypothetical protein
MDDNLYPRNGAFRPTQPIQQQIEAQKEEAQTIAALPVLKELVERWRDRVEFFGSLDSVPDEVLADTELFMHTVAGNKVAKLNLQAELDFIEELIEQHAS